MADPKPEKPYKFDSISKPINQTDLTQWELTLWDYLKSINRYKKLVKKDLVWETEKTENRGFRDDTLGDNKLSTEEKSESGSDTFATMGKSILSYGALKN